MTRATTGHPTRALRGGALLLVVWVTYRAPAMQTGFDAAIAAAEDASSMVAVRYSWALPRWADAIQPATPPKPARAIRPRSPRPSSGTVGRQTGGIEVPDGGGGEVVVLISANTPSVPPKLPAAVSAGETPSDYATAAYARLSARDRRGAARFFDAALAGGDDLRSAAWQAQHDALMQRWSGSAYSIVRAGGSSSVAVAPVLGGGQSGAALAWTPDPLARQPLALTLRGTIAHDDGGRSALAAVGIAWHPFTGVTLSAERLLPIGPAARGDWALRIAGGLNRTAGALDASAYGEAGAVGPVVYSAAQAHLGADFHRHGIAFGPGVGGWASVQHGTGATVDRFDLGPGVTARTARLSLSADYRFRVAGNAAPGSGPVLTLAASF